MAANKKSTKPKTESNPKVASGRGKTKPAKKKGAKKLA